MALFNVIALLLVLSALFSYANHRYLRLPKTVGLMCISLTASLAVIGLDFLGLGLRDSAAHFIGSINFGDAVLKVVLCFLLFAGSLHIDFRSFMDRKWPIVSLATLGTFVSSAIIGFGMYLLLPVVGCPTPLPMCLLFGALISPTDPVAVLSLLKTEKVPKPVEMKIAGESLLNDGVGVVLFAVILQAFFGTQAPTALGVVLLFVQEAVGGLALGLGAGYLAFQFIRRIDDYHVEILVSLALVAGGYALASLLHVSGPLAMVAAGLFIGNYGRAHGMTERTRANLDLFWEVLDDVLNVLLFVLVGFEALLLDVQSVFFLAALLAIPVVLAGRYVSVAIAAAASGLGGSKFGKGTRTILTWGGLRGGISFALALALPKGDGHEMLISVTYAVVVFSVLVQGLTMRPLLRHLAVKEIED